MASYELASCDMASNARDSPYQQVNADARRGPVPRGLNSFTSQLNLSANSGIGGARRGGVARVKGVLGVFRVYRVFVCDRHGSS